MAASCLQFWRPITVWSSQSKGSAHGSAPTTFIRSALTIGRSKSSIGRPIPTVLLLVKRGIVQNTAVFSDIYLSFENRSANAQFWPANCKVHSLPYSSPLLSLLYRLPSPVCSTLPCALPCCCCPPPSETTHCFFEPIAFDRLLRSLHTHRQTGGQLIRWRFGRNRSRPPAWHCWPSTPALRRRPRSRSAWPRCSTRAECAAASRAR